MNKVLITGSEGFVGHHLWEEMKSHDYDVYGTVLASAKTETNKKVFGCDVTDFKAIDSLINEIRPEFVVHLAAISAPAQSFIFPQKTFEVNVIGTLNLLESIQKISNYTPKILLIGSAEEYGNVSSKRLPVDESEIFDPPSPYSVSKLATYYLSKIYHRCYGQNLIYASSFNHTGYGQGPGFLPSDVALQIARIEKGLQEPTLYTGNVDSERDYTDVLDVVRAYRLLLENGISGEKYNVCSGKSISTKDIVDTLIGLSTVKIEHRVDPKRNRPSDMKILFGSHEKITKATGWEPKIPITTTLAELLRYYREQS